MSNLSKTLEEDLKWREAEIASLKIQVAKAARGTVQSRILLRALWVMLYAHYEGFVKYAWDTYLDALEQTKCKRIDCSESIATLSLRKEIRRLRGNLSFDKVWEFCTNEFQHLLKEEIAFHERLETDSNLWPKVLIKNSTAVGLSSDLAREKQIQLRSLVARRNDIAHGKNLVIRDLREYSQYEEAAYLVMHELAISIIDCFESKAYLKN